MKIEVGKIYRNVNDGVLFRVLNIYGNGWVRLTYAFRGLSPNFTTITEAEFIDNFSDKI